MARSSTLEPILSLTIETVNIHYVVSEYYGKYVKYKKYPGNIMGLLANIGLPMR